MDRIEIQIALKNRHSCGCRFFLYLILIIKTETMKKTLLSLVLVFGMYSATNAQSIEVSLGTGALVSSQLKLEGMYHLDPASSTNLELRLINNKVVSEDDNTVEASFTGFAFSPEYIMYFNGSGDDNEGMYAGAYLRFKSMASSGWEELDENLIFVPSKTLVGTVLWRMVSLLDFMQVPDIILSIVLHIQILLNLCFLRFTAFLITFDLVSILVIGFKE